MLCWQQYHSKEWQEPYRYISCQEMSDNFKQFHVGKAMHDQLAQPLSAEYQQQNVSTPTFHQPTLQLTSACA